MMRRGDVYDALLDPTQGSEQAGTRPVIIVSRDAINRASSVCLLFLAPLIVLNAASIQAMYFSQPQMAD